MPQVPLFGLVSTPFLAAHPERPPPQQGRTCRARLSNKSRPSTGLEPLPSHPATGLNAT
jgi:hypothetical protein